MLIERRAIERSANVNTPLTVPTALRRVALYRGENMEESLGTQAFSRRGTTVRLAFLRFAFLMFATAWPSIAKQPSEPGAGVPLYG